MEVEVLGHTERRFFLHGPRSLAAHMCQFHRGCTNPLFPEFERNPIENVVRKQRSPSTPFLRACAVEINIEDSRQTRLREPAQSE